MFSVFRALILGGFLLGFQSCGEKNYMKTGKSIFYLYTPDSEIAEADGSPRIQQQQASEFIIDNSVLMEDVGWDYSPTDDMNTFGDNNSQLMLERETDEPPRLQFKDRSFP